MWYRGDQTTLGTLMSGRVVSGGSVKHCYLFQCVSYESLLRVSLLDVYIGSLRFDF